MKKWMFLLGIIVCWAVIYLIQPTKIALVYSDTSIGRNPWIAIVLENPPITRSAKIDWWENNKSTILSSLNKQFDMKGIWSVNIYELGKGFKMFDPDKPELERYCFDNLPTKLSCIKKEGNFLIRYRDDKLIGAS